MPHIQYSYLGKPYIIESYLDMPNSGTFNAPILVGTPSGGRDLLLNALDAHPLTGSVFIGATEASVEVHVRPEAVQRLVVPNKAEEDGDAIRTARFYDFQWSGCVKYYVSLVRIDINSQGDTVHLDGFFQYVKPEGVDIDVDLSAPLVVEIMDGSTDTWEPFFRDYAVGPVVWGSEQWVPTVEHPSSPVLSYRRGFKCNLSRKVAVGA